MICEKNEVLNAARVWGSCNSPSCRTEPWWGTMKIPFLLLKGHRLAFYLFIFFVKFSAVWGIFVQVRACEIITIQDFLVSRKIFICETLNWTRESGITSHYFKPWLLHISDHILVIIYPKIILTVYIVYTYMCCGKNSRFGFHVF